MQPRILVVDDDRRIADSLRAILTLAGYECMALYSADEAFQIIPQFHPQLVISDVVMPEMSGIELVSELQAHDHTMPVVLLSGNAATEELLEQAADKLGPVSLLAKPCSPRELLRVVAQLTGQDLEEAV